MYSSCYNKISNQHTLGEIMCFSIIYNLSFMLYQTMDDQPFIKMFCHCLKIFLKKHQRLSDRSESDPGKHRFIPGGFSGNFPEIGRIFRKFPKFDKNTILWPSILARVSRDTFSFLCPAQDLKNRLLAPFQNWPIFKILTNIFFEN